jgi:hypothetical protein
MLGKKTWSPGLDKSFGGQSLKPTGAPCGTRMESRALTHSSLVPARPTNQSATTGGVERNENLGHVPNPDGDNMYLCVRTKLQYAPVRWITGQQHVRQNTTDRDVLVITVYCKICSSRQCKKALTVADDRGSDSRRHADEQQQRDAAHVTPLPLLLLLSQQERTLVLAAQLRRWSSEE